MNSRWVVITRTLTTAMVAGAFGGALTLTSVIADEKKPTAGKAHGSGYTRIAQANTRAVKTIQPIEPDKAEKAKKPAEDAGERQVVVEEKKPEAAPVEKAEPKEEPKAEPKAEAQPEEKKEPEAAPVEKAEPKEEPKPDTAAEVKEEISKEEKAKLQAADEPKELDLPKEKVVKLDEPTDDIEQAAYKVLDKHCARCHQDGKLDRLKPAKNFGNVLKLKEIARDPNLVQPGNPDASSIYVQIAKQEMPYDVFQEFSGGPEPTEDELKALRTWIESLGEAVVASCKDRKYISNAAIVEMIAADLENERGVLHKGMRYVTLSHLYNSCASDEEMEVYRQAVVKLLNSLSQNPNVLKLQTIDPAGTIIKFHLDDLKWTDKDWNKVIAAYPYAIKPDHELYEKVKTDTATPLSWVRGDWLAFAASRPALYHDLLKLPKTLPELEKQLGLKIQDNIEKEQIKRAGFQKSLVSRNNRLIERHQIENGVFWTSYDFAGNKSKQSLLEHPLGPKGKDAFEADGGESIFTLPNGFNAYYLNDAKGKQLNSGPTEIVQDQSQRDLKVTNGISCMGCHNQGYRKATDEVRAHVLADKTFSKDVRKKVEAIYPTVEEMNKLIEQDTSGFRAAMRKAGLDPDLDLNGVEMINALSQRFEGDVNLRTAAAEYGVVEKEFSENLGAAGGAFHRMKRRLEQGVVPRDTFEARFSATIGKVSDDEFLDLKNLKTKSTKKVVKVGGKTKEEKHDFELSLVSDKSAYKQGDLAVFSVKSAESCHLTLINVDNKGNGTVIYPNKFQKNNFIKGGKELRFPDKTAGFQFRLKDIGTETVIAVCNDTGKTVDNIKHDYKTRSFTPLGNYRNFLTRQIVIEGKKKVAKGKKAKKIAKKTKKSKKKVTKKSTILARTAIKFVVK
ncbi:MAG: DUF4384 domain-containing protein [Methyloligellaceae bacterium]